MKKSKKNKIVLPKAFLYVRSINNGDGTLSWLVMQGFDGKESSFDDIVYGPCTETEAKDYLACKNGG